MDSSDWSCSGHVHTGLVAFAEEEIGALLFALSVFADCLHICN